MSEELPDEYITTNHENNILIMREINKILRRERLKKIIPAVAQELEKAGVDFSKVDFSKLENVDLDALCDEVEV